MSIFREIMGQVQRASAGSGNAVSIMNRWLADTGGQLEVFEVDSLNATGSGTLSQALADASDTRVTVIVFSTSGWIQPTGYLDGDALKCTKDYVWIAGQTAPGQGIGICGKFGIEDADHVVVDHVRCIRFTRDNVAYGLNDNQGDGLFVDPKNKPVRDIGFRNVTSRWSLDELCAGYSSNQRNYGMAFQGCAFYEGVNQSHAYAFMHYNYPQVLFHSTLFASNPRRHPLPCAGAQLHLQNTYHFNCGDTGHTAAGHGITLNFNYGGRISSIPAHDSGDPLDPDQPPGAWHPSLVNIYSVVMESGPTATQSGRLWPNEADALVSAGRTTHQNAAWWEGGSYGFLRYSDGGSLIDGVAAEEPGTETQYYTSNRPYYQPTSTLLPAADVPAYVLAHSGARPATPDQTDTRVRQQVTAKTHDGSAAHTNPPDEGPIPVVTAAVNVPSSPTAVQANGLTVMENWLHTKHVEVGGADIYDMAEWLARPFSPPSQTFDP